MGYLEAQSGLGAVTQGGQNQRALSALRGLQSLLVQLQGLSPALAGKKFLPSDDATMLEDAPQLRLIQRPTLWPGSNVIAWPASDWRAREADWSAAIAFLGIPKGNIRVFALDRTFGSGTPTNPSAAVATRSLIGLLEQRLGVSGRSLLPWLLVAAAAGLAYATTQKKGKGRRRRGKRRGARRSRRRR